VAGRNTFEGGFGLHKHKHGLVGASGFGGGVYAAAW
jgi:hypothetical protein